MTAARPVALVTGASSGIGRAFAQRLADDGFDLVLIARREDRLRQFADELTSRSGVSVGVVVADVGTAEGRRTSREAADGVGDALHTVVLNAGFGVAGPIARAGRERQSEMVAVNCEAVVDLACHVLPGMIARARGTVIVVSSAAAWQPIPFTATYAATKAFELFFTEALAVELRGTGVRAIACCPGPTATEFSQAAGSPQGPRWVPRDSVQVVVDQTFRALAKGRSRVATGRLAKVTTWTASILPRRVVVWLAGVSHRTFQSHGSD